jgi:crossover junction endodeoxyribonuclease RuvC
MTLVLGIDPGTATTGYGLVREEGDALQAVAFGVIETAAGEALAQRLASLYTQLSDLVLTYKPDAAAVEELFFSRNVRTAMAVGQARGVVLLTLVHARVPVDEYTPREVKQAVAGYGSAAKEQVQEMVRLLLDLPVVPRPDDAADALAIAICHLHAMRMKALLM